MELRTQPRSRFMNRIRRWSIIAPAVASLVVSSLASPVRAVPSQGGVPDGGNSMAAKACQRDGWQLLVRGEDGSPFKDQGDCVAHAARGGQVVRPGGVTPQPDLVALRLEYKTVCTSDRGAFYDHVEGTPVLGCVYDSRFLVFPTPAAVELMRELCNQADGLFVERYEINPQIVCWPPEPAILALRIEYELACTSDGGLSYDDVAGSPVFGCAFVVDDVGVEHPEAIAAMEQTCRSAGGDFVIRNEGYVLHVVCVPGT